jgi:hypothetical protein
VEERGNLGINEITENLELVKKLARESVGKLDFVEYAIELLRKEIEDCNELVDKELFVPKLKFVKERIQRLINRMKSSDEEILACVGINISVNGSIDKTEKRLILGYLINYIDNHIRPGDMLFKVDDNTIGILLLLKDKKELDRVFNRLNLTLLNLKTKTYSDKNILISFDMDKLIVSKESSIDQVIEKFEKLGKSESG